MKKKIVKGVLRCNARGFGFVHSEEVGDVFIPKKLMFDGVDGDIVEVEIDEHKVERGAAGKIVAVLERSRDTIAGTIYKKATGGYLIYSPILGRERKVFFRSKKNIKIGQRAVLRVVNWSNKKGEVEGIVEKFIGSIEDPSFDVDAAMEEFQFPKTFSLRAVEEANKIAKDFTGSIENRVDLTDLPSITVDPATARDFDDALSMSKDGKGFHLWVHISDVAHFVKSGSYLDQDAFLRGNSIYFPGVCKPMLPHVLSSDLCSLKEGEPRYCVSILMDFDKKGDLYNFNIVRSVIKSKKRFTYEEVAKILKDKKGAFYKQLNEMVELALLLKEKRLERGSVELSISSGILEVDDKGEPIALKSVEYDLSHQLIEEFMLKANETIANYLTAKGKTLIYRIHEEPAEINMQEFSDFAKALKFKLSENPTPKDIQNLFEEAKKTPYAHNLSVHFIRSMKLAYYSSENVGHYGLALKNYCHFTSPIRRYSDLIAERLLFNEEGEIDINQIATICSDKERLAMRAEGSVTLLKKLRLLRKIITEDPKRSFQAIITKVKPFGIVFEITSLFLEGELSVREMRSDFFIFDSKNMQLKGRKTKKCYAFGDIINLKVNKLDLIFSEVEWTLIEK